MADFTCPQCGLVGHIDDEQKAGDVSIICPECNWHGYIEGDGS